MAFAWTRLQSGAYEGTGGAHNTAVHGWCSRGTNVGGHGGCHFTEEEQQDEAFAQVWEDGWEEG